MRPVLIVAVVVAALAVAAPALAAPPPNDAFADAAVVATMPYSDSQPVGEATAEPGEPQWCSFSSQTVWYAVTPSTDSVLIAADGGSSIPTNLNVYRQTGSGMSSLAFLACGSFGSGASVNVEAGQTYYVQAGGLFGFGGTLRVSMRLILPPANDDFASATAIHTLAFSDVVEMRAAGLEAGEPSTSCGGDVGATVWYVYRPTVPGSVTARVSGVMGPSLAVYTGTAIGALMQLRCSSSPTGLVTFPAEAGGTYYVRAARSSFTFFGTQMTFSLDLAPLPSVGFAFSPNDPSVFDTLQFADSSWDPAEVGIAGQHFDFGDGASSDGCCPTHRYAADGDYTVTETVTTLDGRWSSQTQTIVVRTHDVTIAKLSVPQSASTGQTRSLIVGVTDARYPETVTVELLRSDPGGDFVTVGTLTQDVPLRSANRTTSFGFTYTFRNDDASVGKVTFKAVATIAGARDALPADNVAVALPTKVGG